MKNRFIMTITFILFSLLVLNASADKISLPDKYPHVVLSNGIIETSVFLPDAQKGFYRSIRYDWSGHTWQLTYKNHTYFLQANEKNPLPLKQVHHPDSTHHGAGFATEFYETGRDSGCNTVMKIGIGHLDAKDINKIIDSGIWKTSYGKNWVEFTHKLKNSCGFSYFYIKRMELTEGKPELVISYSLRNTGTKTLTTEQYNHNFFLIDNDYVGKNYEVELFFPAKFNTFHPEKFNKQKNFLPYAVLKDNKIIFLKDIDLFIGSGDDHGFFTKMGGFSDSVAHNHCIIRNKRTGACVDIRGDFPLSAFNFWAEKCTICPEPFIYISIEPEEMKEWKRVYNFFVE